jgi:RNA polymerase sigma factor (sigma-70 family)
MLEQENQKQVREEFDQFLQRYLYTLSKTYVDSNDCASFVKQKKNRDIQLTLSYLTRYDSYKRLCKFNLLWKHPYIIKETVESVRDTLANDMEDEDIAQTIEISFYTALSKFDPDRGVPLKNYLYHYFKWIFVNDIRKNMWKAPVTDIPSINAIFDGSYIENDRINPQLVIKNLENISDKPITDKAPNELLTEDIDWKWVDGETTGWMFECLSPYERLILKKYYVDETNWREISEELGVDINRLKSIMGGIMTKLRKNIEE